jgi:carnitine O-acetyltransferase
MCFGPLVPDGYGCCYNPRADTINFGLSALYTSPETHSRRFRDALEDSLNDMRDVLSSSQSKL